MEGKNRAFIAVLATFGILALLFQAVGYFGPAWMVYSMKINMDSQHIDVDVSMGLWATTACADTPGVGETCKAVSNDELRQSMAMGNQGETAKVAGLNLLDDFTKIKVLATLGGILSIVGIVFMFLFVRASGTKVTGIVSAASWGAGAILVLAAVGLQAQTNSNFNHGIDVLETMPDLKDKLQMETDLPWAILMSGLGAGLNIIVGAVVALKACYMDNPNSPNLWQRFGNQAI